MLRQFRIKAFVIHCHDKGSPDPRVRDLVNKCRSFGIQASILKCVNFRKDWLNRDGTPNRTFSALFQAGYFDPEADVTGVESAIALSHKIAMHRFRKMESYDYCIILEDDVQLHKNFESKLRKALEAIRASPSQRVRNFGLMYLWNSNVMSTRTRQKKVIHDPPIYEETVPHNGGGVAYIISKEFANGVLEKPLPIRNTADLENGVAAFKKMRSRMAFLTVRMILHHGIQRCRGKQERLRHTRWYDDPCITSPLVHTNWYENSTSHSSRMTRLGKWEHFHLLSDPRMRGQEVPRKYDMTHAAYDTSL